MMTPEFVQWAAKEGPWFLIVAVLIVWLYRGGRYLGEKFFGADGYIPALIGSHKSFLDGVQATQQSMLVQMGANTMAFKELERRVERAMATKSTDPETWRILFVDSPTPMCIINENGTFLHANRAAQRLLAYSEHELRAIRFQDVSMPEDTKADETDMKAMVNEQIDSFTRSKTFKTKYGDSEPSMTHFFRFPRAGGFQTAFIIIIPERFRQ